MTIYETSARFSIVGPTRSRSRYYFKRKKKKLCHGSSAFCEQILIKLHTNVNYDNIRDKLAFGLNILYFKFLQLNI